MTRRSHRFASRFVALAALLLVLAPALASAQVVVKLNDTVNFRFGMQLQTWADWTQDANSGGYSQNFFIRRVRFILLATVAPRVTIFYQTDNPRVGNAGAGTTAAKNINTGFLTQDAYLEWRFAGDPAALQAGLFLVPGSRNSLISTATYTAFDIATWELQGNTLLQGNGGRDYGVGGNGYIGNLGYRWGIYDGARRNGTAQTAPLGSSAGSRNSFRYAARINYDFFDMEKGYTYVGTNNGNKKIVAIGAWGDTQSSYGGYGADAIVDWPLPNKDAIKAEADLKHYYSGHAKGFANAEGVPTVKNQTDFYADAGYYISAAKVQPFFKYESLNFVEKANQLLPGTAGNQQRVGGGINFYVYGNNFKISALWEKIIPKTKPTTALQKDTNHFAIQIQAVYF